MHHPSFFNGSRKAGAWPTSSALRSLLLSAVLLASLTMALPAAETPPTAPAPPAVTNAAYRIAPEDVLDITVQDHADLSKTATVLPDGTIAYPYMGEFAVAGMTLHELTARITAALGKQIANPQVTVAMRAIHERPAPQISILGAVKSPGKRALKAGWRILDLLVDCGGLSVDRPEMVTATLIRGGAETIPVDIARILNMADVKANLVLMPDDVLLVHELDASRTQVQVLGEVSKPGFVPVPRDGSIASVINAVGGPTPKAALSKATILHNGKTLTVDLRGLLNEGKAVEGLKVEAGDTLFIPKNTLWFAVFGAVGRPGLQEYPDDRPVTVLSALSQAGGQGGEANLKDASLVHPSKDGKPSVVPVNLEAILKKGDLSKDLAIQPGDILYVPTRQQKSGGFHLTDVLSFLPFMSLLRL